ECYCLKNKLLIIISIIVLFIVGYFVLKEFKKKHLINEAQKKAKMYVVENYEGVEEVKIDPEIKHFSPMGSLSIGGYINNNEDLHFYITFLINNNEVGEERTIATLSDFPSRKDEDTEEEDD